MRVTYVPVSSVTNSRTTDVLLEGNATFVKNGTENKRERVKRVVTRAFRDGLYAGLYSIIVDWDHIFMWVFGIAPPFTLTGWLGRPFHTIFCFALLALFYSRWCVAFDTRLDAFLLKRSLNK